MQNYTVLTYIIGDYETVHEIGFDPATTPHVEYLLITDNKNLTSNTWKVVYELGVLDYRSLKFIEEYSDTSNGIPVMNFTSSKVPYTRIINHKMFLKETKDKKETILTFEHPEKFNMLNERYYPINNERNNALYLKYVDLLKVKYPKIIPGGRLGLYKYLDMDKTIELALDMEL